MTVYEKTCEILTAKGELALGPKQPALGCPPWKMGVRPGSCEVADIGGSYE